MLPNIVTIRGSQRISNCFGVEASGRGGGEGRQVHLATLNRRRRLSRLMTKGLWSGVFKRGQLTLPEEGSGGRAQALSDASFACTLLYLIQYCNQLVEDIILVTLMYSSTLRLWTSKCHHSKDHVLAEAQSTSPNHQMARSGNSHRPRRSQSCSPGSGERQWRQLPLPPLWGEPSCRGLLPIPEAMHCWNGQQPTTLCAL
jgi:hypothetical protein